MYFLFLSDFWLQEHMLNRWSWTLWGSAGKIKVLLETYLGTFLFNFHGYQEIKKYAHTESAVTSYKKNKKSTSKNLPQKYSKVLK